ncbi:MAG: type II CAAX endopeptidase family protein [Candidatus Eisenbacteria bacterium]
MRPAPIASTRHTLILLAIFGAVTALGAGHAAQTGGTPGVAASRVPLYLGALAGEWLLFRYAMIGLARTGTPAAAIFGDKLRSRRAWFLALLLGPVAWLGIGLLSEGLKHALGAAGLPLHADSARTLASVAPRDTVERVLWVVLSISAGICEEFVFRGYLLRQFAAWFGGPWPGLIASSIVFGLGHAYQGLAPVLLITGLGMAFGAIALLTRRLGPGIVAHALTDLVSGLAGR